MARLYLFFFACFVMLIQPAHASSKTEPCPVISKQFNPDAIALQSGQIALAEYHAKIELPPNIKFIGTTDARIYARHVLKWSTCSTRSLVGLLVSGENWQNFDASDISKGWMITVHYEPTFVSPSDMVTTNYDDIAQQIRESFYERERADDEPHGSGATRHVMGWAIPPDYNGNAVTAIWSLNIIDGNQPDYAVPLHAAKLGRRGHFRLFGKGLISQNEANAALMRQAVNSIKFDKGWTIHDHYTETKDVPTTTIGAVIAESVNAHRATPLNWIEYFRAMVNDLVKFGYRYLLEILAVGGVAILCIIYSVFRSRRSPDAEDEEWEDYGYSDQYLAAVGTLH
jgi:uncharacterized membrane-anchored protein